LLGKGQIDGELRLSAAEIPGNERQPFHG
jgi:hypothetical protein